jgi:2-polyprenyl-6-methoxyphenol hydroxylase-like FAD-dependent oxidoreductase
MEFAGTTRPSDWLLADVHLEGLKPDKLDVCWNAHGILAFFPIVEGRYRVVADLGPAEGEGRRADPTLEEMQALVDQRGPGTIRLHDPSWLATFRINERKVKDYSRGRVFLAGDAAHIHSPNWAVPAHPSPCAIVPDSAGFRCFPAPAVPSYPAPC